MTLTKAVQELCKEYKLAAKMGYIRNPLAWALHQVWRMADRERCPQKYTRLDRFREMSVDEVAVEIKKQIGCGSDFVPCGAVCGGGLDCTAEDSDECLAKIKQWLMEEVTDDA